MPTSETFGQLVKNLRRSDALYSINETITGEKTYNVKRMLGDHARTMHITADQECELQILYDGNPSPISYPSGLLPDRPFLIRGENTLMNEVIINPTASSTTIKILMSDGVIDLEEWSGQQSPATGYDGTGTITTTAALLASASTPVKSLMIKAEQTNTFAIKVGFTSSPNFRLDAGESFSFDWTNLNTIYLEAVSGTQTYYYIAVK